MRRILLCLLMLATAMTSTFAADQKIGTVNLQRVFDGYWKTKVASTDVRGRKDEYDQDLRKLVEQSQKSNESYRELDAKYNNPSLAADDKKKLENQLRARIAEIKEMETEINQFVQHSRTMLAEKEQRLRNNIVSEITSVITTKAREGGYDYVFDVSGQSNNNLPTLIYSSGRNDLTDAVLQQLNADAPADLKADADATALPLAAPASTTPPAAATTTPAPAPATKPKP